MSFTGFKDFGELYRAAFAETDERKKCNLLREVERIIQAGQTESRQPDRAQAGTA